MKLHLNWIPTFWEMPRKTEQTFRGSMHEKALDAKKWKQKRNQYESITQVTSNMNHMIHPKHIKREPGNMS